MPTMNISLSEPLKTFVEERVHSSGYSTVSEYFRELVREDQKRSAQEKLETLLLDGLNSGKAAELTKKDMEAVRRAIKERKNKRGK